MKQFLKFTLASATGLVLGIFLLIFIFGVLAAGSSEPNVVKLKKPHILKLDLNSRSSGKITI